MTLLVSGDRILLEERQLPDIKVPRSLDAKLTAALKKGKLHGFRSGGGLRVFRIDKGDKCFAYGEHPNAMEALALLAKDSTLGGRGYEKVYGVLHPHYLTGSSVPDGELDRWILAGNTVDAVLTNKVVTVALEGYGEHTVPDEILAQARRVPGVGVTYSNRGFMLRSTCDSSGGVSTECLICPPGRPQHRAWMWHEVRTGIGASFFEAVSSAFAAVPVESERG
jgi:hypothetical protein